jgi:hypothetical protein
MNKPRQFLVFLVALFGLMLALSMLMPKNKVLLGPFELGYYSPEDLLGTLWFENPKKNKPLKASSPDSLGSNNLDDSLAMLAFEKPVLDTLIQVASLDALGHFFDALESLAAGKRGSVRIIHYGDSQIEGDRITMQFRDVLQKRFGGRGFGYVALEPLVMPASLEFLNSFGLARKTAFGRRDTNIKDTRYGHLGSFTTLLPASDGEGFEGGVTFKKRNWGYQMARDFSKVKMSLSTLTPLLVDVFVADTLFASHSFPAEFEDITSINVPKSDEFSLVLKAKESPRIYGLSFESASGVWVDNVAMRGASGMIFRKLDRAQFQATLLSENYELVILQYGGNAVPYLKDTADAERFAKAAAAQVAHIKSLHPSASILYIGPSDMAVKNGLKMGSYPIIKVLKSALRNEMLTKGAAYWDLHDVMGGEGAMVRWVEEEEPALAVKDYCHFSPAGAKYVGYKLAAALDYLQAEYIAHKKEEVALAASQEKAKADSILALKAKQAKQAAQAIDTASKQQTSHENNN